MKYAVVDVFYDESQTLDSIRYDNAGDGYTLGEACVWMCAIIKHDPDTHYCYLEAIER